MSPRPRSSTPIADLIAEAVRSALAAQRRGQGQGQGPGAPPPAARRGRTPATSIPAAAASQAAALHGGAGSSGAVASAGRAPAQASPGAPAGAAPAASAVAQVPSAAAVARAAQNELLDRVRADLKAAFDGRPVSPDRLAFRLKVDRDLVDAALTYLVTRKEARAKWIRGRVAYTPALPGLGS